MDLSQLYGAPVDYARDSSPASIYIYSDIGALSEWLWLEASALGLETSRLGYIGNT